MSHWLFRSFSVTIGPAQHRIKPLQSFRRPKLGKLSVGDDVPDFALPDHQGTLIQLSDIYEHQNVLLVFNLGFA
jgi:hypothetical protein